MAGRDTWMGQCANAEMTRCQPITPFFYGLVLGPFKSNLHL